ncbi:glycoside hydrolase family 16 protein [Streptomyces sp. NPDC004752]
MEEARQHRQLGRRALISGTAALAASAALAVKAPAAHAAEFLIQNSFTDYATFEKSWNYLYPWGPDHNGTARMVGSSTNHSQIYLGSGGVLTLKASRISGNEGNSTVTPFLPIHYHSGTVHAKQRITVTDQYPNWIVSGDFQVPYSTGTWPAFWLTATNPWPPEADIMEYMGGPQVHMNTFRTATDKSSITVPVASPGSWHNYTAWLTRTNTTDVAIHYYLDNVKQGMHNGAGFMGKPMYLIFDLQMEGPSGSSGPGGDTYCHARNVSVQRW